MELIGYATDGDVTLRAVAVEYSIQALVPLVGVSPYLNVDRNEQAAR